MYFLEYFHLYLEREKKRRAHNPPHFHSLHSRRILSPQLRIFPISHSAPTLAKEKKKRVSWKKKTMDMDMKGKEQGQEMPFII